MPQRQLQVVLQIEKPTLSGVVAALVRKGLVDQVADSGDRRQKMLSLTAAGRSLWRTLPDPIALILQTAFKGVPKDDLATVVRVLSTGVTRLNELNQKGSKS
jgi:DNA-binding MarR family transcriptional regulator